MSEYDFHLERFPVDEQTKALLGLQARRYQMGECQISYPQIVDDDAPLRGAELVEILSAMVAQERLTERQVKVLLIGFSLFRTRDAAGRERGNL